ncbi:MAG: hypothetical protein SF052_23125 [Bacteroidia bacterium]|nr:hypothetical protein [Bacteroidia bacterium]
MKAKPGIIQQLGYTWVALPTEDIKPLTLLEIASPGILKRIKNTFTGAKPETKILPSTLFSLFPQPLEGEIPKPRRAKAVASFKGKDLVESGAGFDLEGLESFKKIVHAGASGHISKAKKWLYEFESPRLTDIDPTQIEKYINRNQPDRDLPGFLEKLKDNRLFVITHILHTKAFSVRNVNEFSINGEISADAIEGHLAGLSADVNRQKDSTESLSYTGTKPLTFAIRASRIWFDPEKDTFSLNDQSLSGSRSIFESTREPAPELIPPRIRIE